MKPKPFAVHGDTGFIFMYYAEQLLKILKQLMPKRVNTKTGRPGMDLWNILGLGVLRLNCNWDFDNLHDIANNHKMIHYFLGHGLYYLDKRYGLQTIKDNISRLSAQVMDVHPIRDARAVAVNTQLTNPSSNLKGFAP